ncbi:heme exporter protein CcmD [Candidatus Pelagibacter sp. HIMB1321]|uniref:heme exporter protein CcmD n=1 Tax=Candidatus Pelagibacter sp. HIMB1321 TaxID=1388755 RepID=UPI000A07DC4F|nr:heme exporter protein CcmD [Candidatus Pelagibacter sp. HIMB1321]SMF81120.1 heme exporter protein D [Candidatus Pelagibacter sp. HIMB1321]
MINELLNMNGYGLYVWSAFSFTLLSFATLYSVTKVQYIREKNKFIAKYGELDAQKAKIARTQTINQEILSGSQNI